MNIDMTQKSFLFSGNETRSEMVKHFIKEAAMIPNLETLMALDEGGICRAFQTELVHCRSCDQESNPVKSSNLPVIVYYIHRSL